MNSHRNETASSTRKLPLLFPILLGVASLVTVGACSSTDTGSSSAPTTPADAAAATDASLGAAPCAAINSGFPGDDMCIKPPPAGTGMQFHYGPHSYTDAAEVAKYTLKPGQEVTDCVFFTTPNEGDVYFNEYHSRMRPSSHHMLLYIQDTKVTETGTNGPAACNQSLSRNLFGAQTPSLDTIGNEDGAPENNGAAVEIPAHQQVVMQMHFINAGKTDLLREGWANVVFVDKSKVTQLSDPIFFIAGLSMKVAMGETTVVHGSAQVPADAAPDFRLLYATPHYHTHTTRFTVYATIGGQQQKILEEFGSLGVLPEPKLYVYDSVTKNAEPNDTERLGGASSGILRMKPGDSIDWECEIQNNNEPQPLTFKEAVYTGEMCNLFGVYGPTNGSPWSAYGP